MTEINKDTRICSFDIETTCTNIPKIETTDVITNILRITSGINENNQKEITHIRSSNGSNYFQFEEKHYKQTHGLAMGAPTSAVLGEAYIQNMQHKN
jgi:hypothetical protein